MHAYMTTNNYFEVHSAVQKEGYKVCQAGHTVSKRSGKAVLFINTLCGSHADY